MTTMRWYHYVAYLFGGAFLMNTVPHLVAGVSGQRFQSPFASPPGEGLSSPMVNVLWGLFNLVAAYLLILRIGTFDLRQTRYLLPFSIGVAGMAVMLARAFGPLNSGV